MATLWETLTTGLIVSLVFIVVSYWFWKRFDKPTPLMIEREEEKERIREEQRTWRKVEAKMRAEQEEADARAAYEQRKAAERATAIVPETGVVTDAWKTLGVNKPSAPSFEAENKDANSAHRPLDQTDLAENVANDDDVLNAAELVSVRQDAGVQAMPQEPDWELIEKLSALAKRDDTDERPLPDVPDAPDLEQVTLHVDAQAPQMGDEGEPLGEPTSTQELPSEPSSPTQETPSEPVAQESPSEISSPTAESPSEPADTATSDSQSVDSDQADAEPAAGSSHEMPKAKQGQPAPKRSDDDIVRWDLAEGEDLWVGTSWEEE